MVVGAAHVAQATDCRFTVTFIQESGTPEALRAYADFNDTIVRFLKAISELALDISTEHQTQRQ